MVSHFIWTFFWSSKGCYKASIVQSNTEAYSSTVQLKTWLTFKSPDSPPHKGMKHQRTCLRHCCGGPLSYRPARGSLHSFQTTLQFPDTAPVLTAASGQPSSPTAPPASLPRPQEGGSISGRGRHGPDMETRRGVGPAEAAHNSNCIVDCHFQPMKRLVWGRRSCWKRSHFQKYA